MLNLYSPALWRQVLRKNFNQWDKLADFLQLNSEQRLRISPRTDFPLNLPYRLAEKIVKGTLEDPILKQFLPTVQEHLVTSGYTSDPLQDETCRMAPKLLKKYSGRVLLVCTSACAMHCRYCFRQNFEYEVEHKLFQEELFCIAQDASIHEVILSGGDPLSLSDSTLLDLFEQIAAIPHIRRLRIHTRFPMGIPERIDEAFLEIFQKMRLPVWMVIHANHPREFDEDIFSALEQLRYRGVGLLCQSVLLRGVNDSVETLVALSETLIDHGILPYYLHQLDRVQGASHFEVPEEEGKLIMQGMSKQLPGFAIPRYAREVPGEPSKTSIIS